MSLRDTAKGVAIRAGFLGVVGLIVGAWLFGVLAKTASVLVKFIVGLILLAIGAGLAMLEVKKIQRRFDTP
jgi:ABC-type multidrug transport system permease subunit